MSHHRTIVVADHHKSVFVCRIIDRESGEVIRRTLASRRKHLEPFLSSLPRPALVYIEACRAWEWVSDLCEEIDVDFRLVDPRQMPEIARSTKKTDDADVAAMVRRLLVEGELPRSYRISRRDRELRGLTRQLGDLRVQRRKLINKIHAVIDSLGLPALKRQFVKTPWRDEMRERLSSLAWLGLEVLLLQYDHNRALVELLEGQIHKVVRDDPDYGRLQEIPGIGPVIAATILAESAGIERFESARQYAAFTGLVPRVRSSAGRAKIGAITRSGPPDLRWALGQAAMTGRMSHTPSAVTTLYARKKRKGKPTRVAMCAAAHKLARIVYVILARREDFRSAHQAA